MQDNNISVSKIEEKIEEEIEELTTPAQDNSHPIKNCAPALLIMLIFSILAGIITKIIL